MSFGNFDTLCYQTVGVREPGHNWWKSALAGQTKSNQVNALRARERRVSAAAFTFSMVFLNSFEPRRTHRFTVVGNLLL